MRKLLAFFGAAVSLAACGEDKNTTQSSTSAETQTGDATTTMADSASTTGSGEEPTGPTTGQSGTGDASGTAPSSTIDEPTGEPPGQCTGDVQTLSVVRPRTMLVLEKSTRMDEEWDHDADPASPMVKRWSSLHASVDQALAEFDKTIDLGANLYPSLEASNNYDITACPVNPAVEAPVAPANRDAILAVLPPKNTSVLGGGWPVAAALTAAVEHLEGFAPTDPRFIVLILKGLPTCDADAPDNQSRFEVYDQDAPAVAGAAFTDHGIKVHVIALEAIDQVTSDVKDGQPNGVNPVEKFTELAVLGGTEKLVNVSTEALLAAALKAALARVLADEASCTLALEQPLEFPDLAVVQVAGVKLPRIDDCATEDGWRYLEDDAPFTAVKLCGAACEQLRQAGEAEVADCSEASG